MLRFCELDLLFGNPGFDFSTMLLPSAIWDFKSCYGSLALILVYDLHLSRGACKQAAGVSISTDGLRNASVTLLIEVSYFFLQRRSS